MATVQIRNLSDEAYATLKRRADESGRSLQEYLRLELEARAARETREEAMARVRADLTWSGPPLTVGEVVDLIHAGRPA